MPKYTEDYCLAILVTNLGRRKRYPDPITVADCAKTLYDIYGSFGQVASMVGRHDSVIRKWVNLANAPKYLRQCVIEGKIYPTAAFCILSGFSDNNKRSEIAKEVIGWGEPEIVRLIHYMKRNPHLSVLECKNLLITEAMGELLSGEEQSTSETD